MGSRYTSIISKIHSLFGIGNFQWYEKAIFGLISYTTSWQKKMRNKNSQPKQISYQLENSSTTSRWSFPSGSACDFAAAFHPRSPNKTVRRSMPVLLGASPKKRNQPETRPGSSPQMFWLRRKQWWLIMIKIVVVEKTPVKCENSD